MSEITLSEKDLLISDLSIMELIILKIIYNKEESMFNSIKKTIELEDFMEILFDLQSKDYIKYTNGTFEGQFIRPKCEEIFKTEELQFKEIILYLNEKLGCARGFSTTSSANKRFIQARLKDYTIQDLKDVIDTMVQKWKGTDMEKYLRPETLFNETKFQNYYVMSSKKRVVNPGGIFKSTVNESN